MMIDPAIAAQMQKLPPNTRPPLFRWTDGLSRLTDLADITMKKGSPDPDRIPGLPRPLTGKDILRRQERNANIAHIVAKATPQQ